MEMIDGKTEAIEAMVRKNCVIPPVDVSNTCTSLATAC